MVFIDSIDIAGEYHRFGVGGPSLEDSLEHVTKIVRTGVLLLRVELLYDDSPPLLLPVEAFDGSSILEPIIALQQQWKRQLSSSQ